MEEEGVVLHILRPIFNLAVTITSLQYWTSWAFSTVLQRSVIYSGESWLREHQLAQPQTNCLSSILCSVYLRLFSQSVTGWMLHTKNTVILTGDKLCKCTCIVLLRQYIFSIDLRAANLSPCFEHQRRQRLMFVPLLR